MSTTMIDEGPAREALISLFRAGVWHWTILVGVAQALSVTGKRRLDIVNFFGHIMNVSPQTLTEDQLAFLDDFNLKK
jgi:hypothetical protein